MDNKTTFILALGILTIILRVLPHPPNFSPMAGMALFAGFAFKKDWKSAILPVLVLFIGDLLINFSTGSAFYSGSWTVYVAFAIIGLLGIYNKSGNLASSIGWALIASVFFFLFTNFFVWKIENMYTKDLNGLLACYTAGVPFYRNTLLGDVFFTAIVFYVFQRISIPTVFAKK